MYLFKPTKPAARKWMLFVLLLSLLLTAAVPQSVMADSEPDANHYFALQSDSYFRYFMPGVIRPEQGTMEFTVQISKPYEQTGGTWDFLFTSAPTKLIGGSSNTLMAIHLPQVTSPGTNLPAVQQGLVFSMRTDQASMSSVTDTTFDYTVGQRMNIAVSWGTEMRIYVNGVLKASAPFTAPFTDAVMPYMFTIEKENPFYPEQVRISTRERSASELAGSPEAKFKADGDTSLLITNHFNTLQRVVTNWHKSTNFARLQPVLTEDKQTYVQGQNVILPVMTINYGASPRSYQVEVTAKDVAGSTVLTKQFPVIAAADGKYHIQELPLPELNGQGYYKLTTKWTNASGTLITKEHAIAVLPPDDTSVADGALENYLGYHHLTEVDPAPITKLDIQSIRVWGEGTPFTWYNVEAKQGIFDWTDTDKYVAEAKAAGLDILPVLGYPPLWAADPTLPAPEIIAKDKYLSILRPDRWKPRSMEEWGNYVYQMVSRYKDDIKHWEIWNEVNFQPPYNPAAFSGTRDDYLELLRVAYQKAKEADPDSVVLTSGFSDNPGADPSTPIEAAKIPSGTYDILNLHGYQGITSAQTQAVLAQYKTTRPEGKYWMTEYGPFNETAQFDRLYRLIEFPILFLEKGFERFYMFSEYSTFMSRHSMAPNLDYSAFGVLQSKLRKANSFAGLYTFPNDSKFSLKHQLTRTDNKTLSILGSKTGEYAVTVSGTPLEVTDWYGKTVPVTTTGGQSTFHVKGVVYITSSAPLQIVNTVTTSPVTALIYNGGFESPLGDINADPTGVQQEFWTYHEKDWDPKGNIIVNTDKRSGNYAMKFTSGGGKVNMDQPSQITQSGRYQITAYVKMPSGQTTSPQPYVFVNNPNAATPNLQTVKTGLTSSYTSMTLQFEVTSTPTQPITVGTGILSGAGSIFVDDFQLTYLGPL